MKQLDFKMNNLLHNIIRYVLKNSLSEVMLVEVPNAGVIGVRIADGFYKSGGVVLHVDDADTVICTCRYGEQHAINAIDDLVDVSYDWFRRSQNRGVTAWKQPAPGWGDEYVRGGCMTKKEVTVYE